MAWRGARTRAVCARGGAAGRAGAARAAGGAGAPQRPRRGAGRGRHAGATAPASPSARSGSCCARFSAAGLYFRQVCGAGLAENLSCLCAFDEAVVPIRGMRRAQAELTSRCIVVLGELLWF